MTASLPTVGGSSGTWGTQLNSFLLVSHNGDGTLNSSAVLSASPGSRGATIVVAAANSSAAGKATADYVCTGTSTTGGDETTINSAFTALAATTAGWGKVLLLEGTYWTTGPVICDTDNTDLEGQGLGTIIACRVSGGAPTGYARIIFGNTRTLFRSSIRNLCVQPQGTGISLVTGSGHGVVLRSNTGRLENVIVQSAEKDGYRVGGCTNPARQVTVSSAVNSTDAEGASVSWNTATTLSGVNTPCLAKVHTSAYVGTPGNDDSIETVVITAAGSGTVQVIRGFDGTTRAAIASGAVLVPIDPIYEVGGLLLHSIYPGVNGMTVEFSAQNCEFIRCIMVGGGYPGGPNRGQYGFRAFGNIIKFLLCHAYDNQLDGLIVNCADLLNGANGAGEVQVIGGEYETNGLSAVNATLGSVGGYGIRLVNAFYCQLINTVHYANYTGSIYLSSCDRTVITGQQSTYQGASGTGFVHVTAVGSTNTRITGGSYQKGEANGIVVSGYSIGTTVHGNTICTLDPASGTAYAIYLTNFCTDVTVTDNVVDRPIVEDSNSNYNVVKNNRILNTNNAPGDNPAGITASGALTISYGNPGQSDVISKTASFTAQLRKTYLVNATSGSVTVSVPGAGTFGTSTSTVLDSSSYAQNLASATSLKLNAIPGYCPIAGDMAVPITGGTGYARVTYTGFNGGTNVFSILASAGTTVSAATGVYLLPPDGEEFYVCRTDSSGNTVTLAVPAGSQLNGGTSALTLSTGHMYRCVISNGNWIVY